MSNRIDIDTFEGILDYGREIFLDAIIVGTPIGKNIENIVRTAYEFGCDEAHRAEFFPMTVKVAETQPIKAVVRDQVASAMNTLFNSTGNDKMDGIVTRACMAGAALGFQLTRERLNDPEVEALMQDIIKRSNGPGKMVGDADTNAFMAAIEKLPTEQKVRYVRRFLCDYKMQVNTTTGLRSFIGDYSNILVDS